MKPFNAVPRAVVTLGHKNYFPVLLLHNSNFATVMSHNVCFPMVLGSSPCETVGHNPQVEN